MGVNFRTTDGVVHEQSRLRASSGYDETVCGMFLVSNQRHKVRYIPIEDGAEDVIYVYGRHRAGEKPNDNADDHATCVDVPATCVICLAGE